MDDSSDFAGFTAMFQHPTRGQWILKKSFQHNHLQPWLLIVQGTTDAPEYESRLQTAAKTKEKHRDEDIPMKPAHYETLLDMKSESDSTVNVGKRSAGTDVIK